MRKKVLLSCTLLLLVAIIAGGTAAYLNQGEKATNVISMGKVTIQLNDKAEDRKTDFPQETLTVMPGVSVPKNVWVTNTGADAWVRVKATVTVTKNGDEMDNTFGTQKIPVCALTPVDSAESKWIDGRDGYYYYTEMVPAGKDTQDLFNRVAFDSQLPNAYQGCTVEINLDAQAVQYKNNEANNDVSKVQGWPEDSNANSIANLTLDAEQN